MLCVYHIVGENLVTAFDIFFRRQNKLFILKWSQMQYFKQFVKERQEIKPLRTCLPYCLTFPKNIWGVSVLRFALQKTFHVDTRFSPDTDDILVFGIGLILQPIIDWDEPTGDWSKNAPSSFSLSLTVEANRTANRTLLVTFRLTITGITDSNPSARKTAYVI